MSRVEFEWFRRRETEPHPFPLVSILGPMSVGKTTLTKLLAEELGFSPLYEEFEDNPFLKRLNELKKVVFLNPDNAQARAEIQELSIASELWFLNRKATRGARARETLKKRPVVIDTDIFADVLYAQAFVKEGIMKREDFDFYLGQLKVVLGMMPVSDLIIGLKVSPQTLVERKNARGRDFEEAIPDEELILEANLCNRLIDEAQKDRWPLLVIDTDQVDFANSTTGKTHVVSLIRDVLN